MTNADAREVADDALALWRTKRPSITILLDGVNANLVLGTYVNITFARPTIAAADYKIRRIEREYSGIGGLITTVYAGLGDTKWDEKIIKEIRLANRLAHKSMTDRLQVRKIGLIERLLDLEERIKVLEDGMVKEKDIY